MKIIITEDQLKYITNKSLQDKLIKENNNSTSFCNVSIPWFYESDHWYIDGLLDVEAEYQISYGNPSTYNSPAEHDEFYLIHYKILNHQSNVIDDDGNVIKVINDEMIKELGKNLQENYDEVEEKIEDAIYQYLNAENENYED